MDALSRRCDFEGRGGVAKDDFLRQRYLAEEEMEAQTGLAQVLFQARLRGVALGVSAGDEAVPVRGNSKVDSLVPSFEGDAV